VMQHRGRLEDTEIPIEERLAENLPFERRHVSSDRGFVSAGARPAGGSNPHATTVAPFHTGMPRHVQGISPA
jgi:hypothetical protein